MMPFGPMLLKFAAWVSELKRSVSAPKLVLTLMFTGGASKIDTFVVGVAEAGHVSVKQR
jgi:hypothetical protein